jgi:hypothetical protein
MAISDDQLLLKPDQKLTCPSCDHEFELSEGFAKRALEKIEERSAEALAEREEAVREEIEKKAKALAAKQAKAAQEEAADLKKLLDEQSKKSKELIEQVKASERASAKLAEDELKRKLDEQTREAKVLREREGQVVERERTLAKKIEEEAASRAQTLIAEERSAFEQRIETQGQAISEMRSRELALLEEKQRLADERSAFELESARKIASERAEIESKIRAQEQERMALDKAELQKTIDDMSEKLAEAQRKAEQGSQQLHGEVLELAIEDGLRREFPLDVIEEVKKGQRGGDVVQRVQTRQGQQAAVILWETKRARDFSAQWFAKLKDDMRACGADIGVLVTTPTAVPKDFPAGAPFALSEDIWIVTWTFAISLAGVLRAGAIDVYRQRLAASGKGEKMEALYDYVTSPQFAQKLRAVYDTFARMREDLESEKNQATQRWARREKQLAGGITALLCIGGDVQGLAEQALPALEMVPVDQRGQ